MTNALASEKESNNDNDNNDDDDKKKKISMVQCLAGEIRERQITLESQALTGKRAE